MRRLDWQLIRPRTTGRLGDSFETVVLIRRLSQKHLQVGLNEAEASVLNEAETSYLDKTRSCCDAVAAPSVCDSPDWESRLVDDYALDETDEDLETYIEARQNEPDCTRCPAVSPYSVFPIAPCEFSAGELEQIVPDEDLRRRLSVRMNPEEMRELARLFEITLDSGTYVQSRRVDSEAYLIGAIAFLRGWAERGFGVLPIETDEFVDFEPEHAAPAQAEDDEPLTFH